MSDQPTPNGSGSPTLSEKQRGKLPATGPTGARGVNVDINERDILLDESRLDQVRYDEYSTRLVCTLYPALISRRRWRC